MKLRCGLLGKKLGHSYSPAIHRMLADYDYRLIEKGEEEVEAFLREGSFDGLNVTIPYKKTVLPYLDALGETAAAAGSVNTIVRRTDGTLFGENTDVYGFLEMVRHSGIPVEGKKVLVLGSGGASVAVVLALRMLQAQPVIISRTGENNYQNLDRHADAAVIVNTTPVGMYPEKNGEAPLDLRLFPHCIGVLDLIYNPARTALLLQAEQLGIPHENGLRMLVAQAKRSAELFLGKSLPDSEIRRITAALADSMENILLIGMPGCGKSSIAAEIGRLTGRTVYDCDAEISKTTGRSPAQIITEDGEEAFRTVESEVLAALGKQSHGVIATGGGAVTKDRNYALLHQNGCIVWIQRPLRALPSKDRPLSEKYGVEALYAKREPMYRAFADVTVEIASDQEASAKRVLEAVTRFRQTGKST